MKGRMDRWRRRFGFDTNNLRRDVDRFQWRIGLVLLVAFLTVTPPLTVIVAGRVYEAGERASAGPRRPGGGSTPPS